MNNPENRSKLYKACRKLWGDEFQLDRAVEEAAEMIQARMKAKRNTDGKQSEFLQENLIDEIADVLITANQARHIVGKDLVDHRINVKLRGLQQVVEDAERPD